MLLWWAKRSLPPSSGVMNPKPFESLNHFTVPVDIGVIPFLNCMCADKAETRFRARCSRGELDCRRHRSLKRRRGTANSLLDYPAARTVAHPRAARAKSALHLARQVPAGAVAAAIGAERGEVAPLDAARRHDEGVDLGPVATLAEAAALLGGLEAALLEADGHLRFLDVGRAS